MIPRMFVFPINMRLRWLGFRAGLAVITMLLIFMGVGLSSVHAQSANPFGVGQETDKERSAQPTERKTSPFGVPSHTTEQAPEPLFVMPAPMRAVFRQVADWQREINRYLAGQLRESSQQGGISAALTVIFASFVYGVLHAAGPGHGKLVVASYFTARQAPLRTGILMGSVIALTQAVVAIGMVALLAMVLGGSQLEIIDQTTVLEVVSYGLILMIGLYMTYGTLTGKATCGHDHGSEQSLDGHQHDSTKETGHIHGHSHGPDPTAKETWFARAAGRWLGPQGEVIAVGMISGVRPCTGSILVLLFAVANGVFILGVIASFMMAAGVAITISVLGIGAIVLRRSIAGDNEDQPSQMRDWLGRGFALTGSLAVAVLGGLLFGGALERTGFLA